MATDAHYSQVDWATWKCVRCDRTYEQHDWNPITPCDLTTLCDDHTRLLEAAREVDSLWEVVSIDFQGAHREVPMQKSPKFWQALFELRRKLAEAVRGDSTIKKEV